MTYTDYFLKFNSKEEAVRIFSSIPDHSYVDMSGQISITQQTENFAIDEVGVLYEDDAVYDLNNGRTITPPTRIDGYHYNYRFVYGNKEEPTLPTELNDYIVTPETPKQIFL